jgi:release factor glutamine methyltransferase
MIAKIDLLNNYSISLRYTDKVYDPTRSSVDTIVVADAFIKDEKSYQVIDVGCGSGVLAIGLKKLNPKTSIIAVDIDEEAIKLTKENAQNNHVKINAFTNDLLNDFNSLDMVVANLPTYDAKQMEEEVLHGPRVAYYADDKDGLALYRDLFKQAQKCLKSGGFLIVECQEKLKEQMRALGKECMYDLAVETDNAMAFYKNYTTLDN